ncbi:MAG: thiamine pyrophosphate-binding protein [Gemmatimonadota bacterium]
MRKLTAGEIVVRALEDEGIRYAFGIPGTHNIELYDALGAAEEVRPFLVTDEQSASFMADGYWRASGELACVNVVPGAGLTHALSGIAEAYMDTVPLLVLGCGIRRDTGRAYQLHDVDQFALVEPVTKGRFRPMNGVELYRDLRDACLLARSGAPGPVFVEVPANLYLFPHPVTLPARRAPWPAARVTLETKGASGTEAVRASSPGIDPDGAAAAQGPVGRGSRALLAAAEDAARILRAARRPLVYAGLGAAGGRDALLRIVEQLEAPFSTTFQGVREVVAECDATLAVGCRFGEVATGSYGLTPPGPLIHVDIDPAVLNANHATTLAVNADARIFLEALLEALLRDLPRTADEELRRGIREGHQDVRARWAAGDDGGRVSPPRLLAAAQRIFGPRTVFTTDSGNGTFLALECLRLDEPGRFLAPVDYSCMGYSVPAAIGAKLARPEAPVVALTGDGAFLMTGLEMITAAQETIGVVAMVLRDRELAQIAQFQDTAMNRKVASALPDYDLRGLARGMGCEFLHLDSDAEIDGVLEKAREIAGYGFPVVVDVAIDYSRKTWFTRGVVQSNLLRFPLRDRVRFIGRALVRRVTG